MNFVDSVLRCYFLVPRLWWFLRTFKLVGILFIQIVCFRMVCISSISLGATGFVAYLTVD